MCTVAAKYSQNLRSTKQYSHLSHISFKIAPLCYYILLPTNVKVLETLVL